MIIQVFVQNEAGSRLKNTHDEKTFVYKERRLVSHACLPVRLCHRRRRRRWMQRRLLRYHGPRRSPTPWSAHLSNTCSNASATRRASG